MRVQLVAIVAARPGTFFEPLDELVASTCKHCGELQDVHADDGACLARDEVLELLREREARRRRDFV